MNFLRKHWAFLFISGVSLLLGVLVILTVIRLSQQGPVAPTVPQSQPQAADGVPVPACTLTFTISLASPGPSATPSPSPSGVPTPTPQATPSPSPSPSVTPSPTPSASPVVQCNDTCTTNSQCPSGLVCFISSGNTSGNCRNASCTGETDCTCAPAASASPSPSPSVVPEVPQAGNSWPTLLIIMGAALLLILGLALP